MRTKGLSSCESTQAKYFGEQPHRLWDIEVPTPVWTCPVHTFRSINVISAAQCYQSRMQTARTSNGMASPVQSNIQGIRF